MTEKQFWMKADQISESHIQTISAFRRNSVLVGYQDAGVTDSTASLFEQIAVRASSGQRQDQNIVFQIVD